MKKLHKELVKKLKKELKGKKSVGRCHVDLSTSNDGAYINVCYPLSNFSSKNDRIVIESMNKVLGKHFEESGSGAGMSGRDIGFCEREAA